MKNDILEGNSIIKNKILKKITYHVQKQIGESTKMSCLGFDMIILPILMFQNVFYSFIFTKH